MMRRAGMRRAGRLPSSWRENVSGIWLAALAIILSVFFVVTATIVANSVKEAMIQGQIAVPLSSTHEVTTAAGTLPEQLDRIGLPVTRKTARVSVGPDVPALADRRSIVVADDTTIIRTGGTTPGRNEVALDEDTGRILGVAIGDRVWLGSPGSHWRVSGLVRARVSTEGRGVVAVSADGLRKLVPAGPDRILVDDPTMDVAGEAAWAADSELQVSDIRQEVARERAAAVSDLGPLGGLLTLLTAVSAVAGIFVVGNTFAVLATARRKRTALLRTIGATRGQIHRRLLGEAIALGALASTIGVLLGWATGAAISRVLAWPQNLTPGIAIWGLVAGVTVTLVAAWQPLRGLVRVSPVAALADAERTEVEPPSPARWVMVIPLLVAAFFILQIPILGSVMGGLLTFIILILLGPFLIPRLARHVVGLPGRRGPHTHIARANISRYPRRSSRTALAVLMGVALMSSTTAVATAVTRLDEFSQGPTQVVYTPDANEAFVDDLKEVSGVEWAFAVSGSEVRVKTPLDAQELSDAAAQVFSARPGTRIGDPGDLASDTAVVASIVAIVLGSMAVLALTVGLLGVINTMLLTVRDRRQEFAVLRAVGMTRSQLLRMVVGEAVGLAGIGVVMGLALGAATVYGLLGIATVILIPFVSWWLIIAICAGLLAVTALGAVGPAALASRVHPAQALSASA